MQKGKRGRAKTYDTDSLMFRSVMGIILIALGIMSVISIVGGIKGVAFSLVKQAMQGLGGGLCLGIPLFLIWAGALVAFSAHKKAPVRAILFLSVLYICVLGIVNLLSQIGTSTLMAYAVAYNQGLEPLVPSPAGYWEIIKAAYQLCGTSGAFGGAMGMITAWPLWTYIGTTGGVVILSVLCLVCVLFFSKFDLVGVFRQMRESAEQKAEQHEVERLKQENLKKMQEQQAAEEKRRNSLMRPAYERMQEKEQKSPQNPLATDSAGLYGGSGAYQQAMPVSAMGGTGVPLKTTMFSMPLSSAKLYDEMIVPEMPDGVPASNWKLKDVHTRQPDTNINAAGLQAQAAAQIPRDRETNKVIDRMEANRKRKEQIAQQIGEMAGTAQQGMAPEMERSLKDARIADGLKKQKLGRKKAGDEIGAPQDNPYNNVAQTSTPPVAGNPNSSAMGAQQREYANQTAGYQNPTLTDAQLNAAWAGVGNKPTTASDRFEAYRRPSGEAASQSMMSGERLDKPNIKFAQRPAATEAGAPMMTKRPYPYPMIELLNLRTHVVPDTRDVDRANAMKLEQTLESFGIPARVQHVTHGPAVTRFELGLVSSGINVKRIMNIADNIALDMAANGGVRIEVPIPGTNLFGVEVPNQEIISVSLAEVLTSPEMTSAKSPLSVALGKDIAGRPVICDLAKMPHLLIAGQTGSGKSVCVNSIINSLLYRATPEEVRMIMIDPKVVELQGYNKVPHLLIPVVSDPHKASGALAWAVQEMLDRYHKMQSKGVREITAYNAKVTGDEPKLPRIVIIIDELSDLMLACKKEVEESIIRLAQLARAAGIHVVVATQRPTVNVITGLIKANIPSRIAFAVASSIDSRTILDMNGAEKLLGRGDMFYHPTGAKAPMRVQGCFLSDSEITNIVDYIGNNSEPDYDETINEIMDSPDVEEADNAADSADDGDNDDRLQEAIEMVLTDGQASISMLQRRMKIGYARAGRLIDDMASRGIVSKSAGSKPREILISYEQYLQQKDILLR